MKKSTLLLTICLALSNCSISIESKSNQPKKGLIKQIDLIWNTDYNFVQNQTIIRGELLTRLRGREADIVPQLSERMKFGNYLPCTVIQLDWTYGIKTQVLVWVRNHTKLISKRKTYREQKTLTNIPYWGVVRVFYVKEKIFQNKTYFCCQIEI